MTVKERLLNLKGHWKDRKVDSKLLKNFPQFVLIHTVKGFGIVSKAEIDVFLELSCFFDDPGDAGKLISGSSAFSKSSLKEVHGSHTVETWLGEF